MSERADIAERIFKFCKDNGLAEVYADWFRQEKERDGKKPLPIYVVLFAKRRNLDGSIEIYGKNFMKMEFQTRYSNVSHMDRIVFRSEEKLIEFLKRAFVDFSDDAYSVVEE